MESQHRSNLILVARNVPLIFIALFILGARRCQSLWYIRPIALLVIFYLAFTTMNIFTVVFLFRYVRLVVNLVAFRLYRPVAVSDSPKLTAKDVTVIIPTVEPGGDDFDECIRSIRVSGPAGIVVVTAGRGNYERAAKSLRMYPGVMLEHCEVQNKRRQICKVLSKVSTKITILCDDHVFWPENFLPNILAPFNNDAEVGCVGTKKRVRRHNTSPTSFLADFCNFLGCLYLERHNFEIAATNTIDGGVFVVSGRTSAHRTCILQEASFRHGFLNERPFFFSFFFGNLIDPLNADDDNFITRWTVDHGWKIRIQSFSSSCIETTLGRDPVRFLRQCMRWARTTWRSNAKSLLLSKRTWQTQPWCIYAVHLTSLVNFALVTDPLLIYLFFRHQQHRDQEQQRPPHNYEKPLITMTTLKYTLLITWILGSKLVKPWPHFRRHPRDWRYLPGYIAFGYLHSLLKLWALLTVWDGSWGSRSLSDSDHDHDGVEEVDGGEMVDEVREYEGE